jgi:hypothetical protein
VDGINFVWWPQDFKNVTLYSSKIIIIHKDSIHKDILSQKNLYQYNIMLVSKLIYYDENNILFGAHQVKIIGLYTTWWME